MTSQDSSTSPQRKLDQSTAETIMSLQDNRSDSNMAPNSMNPMEELRQQLKVLESNNMKLQLVNQDLEEGQIEQTSKLKEMDRMLIIKEAVNTERDKVIHTFQTENTALVEKNVELRGELSTAQTQICDGKTAINRKAECITGLALRFSVCCERNKELESLVETSDLKVNTLEDQLRSEKVEKETCLRRTKELESLVEATEKKWLNVQEDSQQKAQKMEEDIKSLIVKSIKLQELALMSDSDKARRSEENRQIQKKQKTERVQREMKLKDREKQEKKKQQKIWKLLHQWFSTFFE